ncbi:hypothetical protein FSP39_022249 [Pinctada imbricata]|uniref:NEDD8 ultimate buster 1 n=1 Tax=Pinctada imbricata TaxID=66713 RepID=A0AA89BRR1_PINIB|nr:hypothetical protein FSP39_022249 [Pinctada imbricata]
MTDSYPKSLHQQQIRVKLNAEKIKLWLPPYTTDAGEKGESPKELIQRYSAELKLSEEEVEEAIECLRCHAVQKLAEREQFQKEGLATLKVKVAGKSGNMTNGNDKKKTMIESIEIPLLSLGSELRKFLSQKIEVPEEQLKLICQGHVIRPDQCLSEQNVKHGSQMMCLVLTETEAESARKEAELNHLMSTRQAAELLSDRAEKDDDAFGIQIADQSGRPLQLPAEERKALTLAMTLHEKGRVAVKRGEIAKALLLLLEADKEFRKCRADILNAVDNYAVLCLDIAWCYLCLKNIEHLPDADERLQSCEDCFNRSYGSNLERLSALKGGSGREQALFMKLHLLQGIIAFHQHKISKAEHLLNKASGELGQLQVDSDKLAQVIGMGFKEQEARLGLRASRGDIERAVQHIMQRREEKAEIGKKVKEERRKKKLQKDLGKTASGELINVDNYEMLIGMGFNKGASAEALRQANNDISAALEVLQNHPELLSLPDPAPSPGQSITDEMISTVIGLGFDAEMARRALQQFDSNIQRAIEALIQNGGFLAPSPTESGGSNSDSGASSSSSEDDRLKKQQEEEKIRDLVSDIPQDEEDYLDLKLDEEAHILQEYMGLLQSVLSTKQ